MSTPESPTDPSNPAYPLSDGKIILEVGERYFKTTAETLSKSLFFKPLLSGRWDSNKQADGSFFIDADPGLFEHLLRFMRRGVFPLFYHPATGHDHYAHHTLLKEAEYFQIPDLVAWLRDKKYREAATLTIHTTSYTSPSHISGTPATGIVSQHVYHEVEKVYVCPRGIRIHRGNPDKCGRACDSARGDADVLYDEVPRCKTMVLSQETVLDSTLCDADA